RDPASIRGRAPGMADHPRRSGRENRRGASSARRQSALHGTARLSGPARLPRRVGPLSLAVRHERGHAVPQPGPGARVHGGGPAGRRSGRGARVVSAGKTVIVGAGPTGLSAAFHLGPGALLVERASRVGGARRSFVTDGFTFDLAGHVMFSHDPYLHELYTL